MKSGKSIDSSFAGTPLRELETAVTWRDTMNYAAALGDANPRYFDDEEESGVIAHPVFPVAVTWRILGRVWEFIDSREFPTELLATQVHYTEHLVLHRPLVPGIALVIRGDIAAILPHRAGTHVVLRLAASEKGGGPVFTEYIGAMLRGVECLGGGAGAEELPDHPPPPAPDAPLWESAVHIDPLRPYIYDGCSDIFFPIHTSKQFARRVGLPGIILQGTATLAFAVTELVNRELNGDAGKVRSLACRFTGMVLPGSDLTVRLLGRIAAGGGLRLFFEARNAAGERAIRDGYLTAE